MRKLIGIDLDGWHDLAVRDTPLDGSEDDQKDDIAYPNSYVIDGGTGGIVVHYNYEEKKDAKEFVGGPQAKASAIGRGVGWGSIGAPNLRKSVKALLVDLLAEKVPDDDDTCKMLQASVSALTAQTDELIATVPDHARIDDERQERLLSAYRRRGLKVTLLWHSVAVVLDALRRGILTEAETDKPVLIVRHVTDGFELQTLTLRNLKSHPGTIAPERAEPGRCIEASCGIAGLLLQSENIVRAANPDFEFERHDESQLPLRLLLDDIETNKLEILRTINGLWSAATTAPRLAFWPDFDLPRLDCGAAKIVLLTTPIAAPYRDSLRESLSAATGMTVILMPLEAAAHGALLAGRRIEYGVPHYLDRLEQVSLLVMRNGEIVPEDLVPPNSVVAANREFVAKPVSGLAWPAMQRTMEFYIRKGGLFKKWTTTDVQPSVGLQPVEVQLRQMPAQGRARVRITSQDWDALRSNPVDLDWSTLQPVDLSLEEIAEILRPLPVVPERVKARAHLAHWKGTERIPAFEPFILQYNSRSQEDLLKLGNALKRQYVLPVEFPVDGAPAMSPTRLLDYDGNPPAGADPLAIIALDKALESIASVIMDKCRSRTAFSNNHMATAATWSFGRCPEEVQEEILKAAEAYFAARRHPLNEPRSASRVLVHGIGRTVTSLPKLEWAIDLLIKNGLNSNSVAALASLLSRPAATPQALTEERCRRIAILAEEQIANLKQQRSYGINLNYALALVGGLLRSREVRPYAMVVANSTEASKLHSTLSGLLQDLEFQRNHSYQAKKRIVTIGEILKLLEGSGGKAGILVDLLEEMDEDETEQ